MIESKSTKKLLFKSGRIIDPFTKKTFNGVEALKCTTFEDINKTKKAKKSSKYEIVVLKDGRRLGNKKRGKRGKSRLFK